MLQQLPNALTFIRLLLAFPLAMTAIYKVIKEDPEADIAEVLTQAEEEYNAGN